MYLDSGPSRDQDLRPFLNLDPDPKIESATLKLLCTCFLTTFYLAQLIDTSPQICSFLLIYFYNVNADN